MPLLNRIVTRIRVRRAGSRIPQILRLITRLICPWPSVSIPDEANGTEMNCEIVRDVGKWRARLAWGSPSAAALGPAGNRGRIRR